MKKKIYKKRIRIFFIIFIFVFLIDKNIYSQYYVSDYWFKTWFSENKFIINFETGVPLVRNAYNFLFGGGIKMINIKKNFFYSFLDFWFQYGNAKAIEEIKKDDRILYGLYSDRSYLLDNNIYRAFNDVTVSYFCIGNNFVTGFNTKILNERLLTLLIKFGVGYHIEKFNGTILNDNIRENLGSADGPFGLLGGEILFQGFELFDKKFYMILNYDEICMFEYKAVGILKIGIGIEV